MSRHGSTILWPATRQGRGCLSRGPTGRRRFCRPSLGHRFERLRNAAELPDATLHRLRHTVGTHLVAQGKILKAAARQRHRDPSTTLRNYADALPLDDEGAADELDILFNGPAITRLL
ncbi:tyrosine-type recombinase/integrase [Amycolatopsis sp. cmx-4-61]|uniref:tyrosine-type recombinase/integrase n=1 Tax=Amycolatopsis sp. cmx-4-61 TaxID=2790937 RepID=UPI00397B39FC